MATDKWLELGGTEMVNLSRTVQLADAMGISDSVFMDASRVEWIETARMGADYDSVESAPWYDPDYPASSEFAGLVPLSFPGLDDSSVEASTTEYITDGGRSGRQRNATQTVVASVALIALTERGVEYGKRWLDRLLRGSGGRRACSGVDLRFYRYADASAPVAHRRQVRLTRGTSVTRKRLTDCSATWFVTFTLTSDDPFVYGDAAPVLDVLGGAVTGAVESSGSIALLQQSCPRYDYTPIYDPLFPALIPSPVAPDFYPAGWNIEDDMTFTRYWARVTPTEPSALSVVPLAAFTTGTDARRVRFSVWPSDSAPDDQCDPLFSVVVNYLPADQTLYVDGEQKACYIWDGFSDSVRRADSLVYSPDAKPVEWASFNDPDNLLVSLDIFYDGAVVEGNGEVRASLSLIPKSD